jgi:exoribonuclease R
MSELLEPPRIITADCSFPKEIDDGLFIEPLDEDHELYRVGVCVADTSKIYENSEISKEAFNRTEAKYWDLPDGERGYDPMIRPEAIKKIELTEGTLRNAMIVRFLVGAHEAPRDVRVTFEKVEVAQNISYKQFSNFTYSKEGRKFLRASALIRSYLGYVAYGDHIGSRPQWRSDTAATNVSGRSWKRGSQINESFMVAAYHLVGKMMAAEDRPAIYRVHDPNDEQYLELLSANVARYSRVPGPHAGLGLDPYSRVTSPLRRLDDFVNNYQLRQRDRGHAPTEKDLKDVAFAVRRLNQELVASAPKEISRLSRRDILGRATEFPLGYSTAG